MYTQEIAAIWFKLPMMYLKYNHYYTTVYILFLLIFYVDNFYFFKDNNQMAEVRLY